MAFDLFSVKNESLSLKLRSAQMTVSTIGKIFNLVSDSIFLIGEDGTVATPAEDGCFDTYDMSSEVTWTVSGSQAAVSSRGTSSFEADSQQISVTNKTKWRPTSRSSVVATSQLASSRNKASTHCSVSKSKQESKKVCGSQSWTKTVEICCYEPSNDSIKKTFNLPLTLSEQTATVPRIADITASEAFEGDPVVLLDGENLRIPDSVGTRGSKYWRSTRKIRVIRQNDYSAFRGKKKVKIIEVSDSDSDSVDSRPPLKHPCVDMASEQEGSTNIMINRIESLEKNMINHLEDQKKLKDTILSIENEKNETKKSLDDFKRALSCIICKSLACFPWVITPCCTCLMCEGCSSRWLMMEASCPHCRAIVVPGSCCKVQGIHALGPLLQETEGDSDRLTE